MAEKFLGVEFPEDYESWGFTEQSFWCDGVRAALKANGLEPERKCPYTHSHTSQWCGYDTCRDA